jgi:nucleoid-associated protein YgaU
MRRNAVTLLAFLFVVTSLSGCSLFKKKKDPMADAAYDPAMETGMPVTDPYGGSYPSGGGFATTGGGKSHTVQKGETLYKIARSYYNDQSRWKDIYAANRAEIGDPNRIRVGQRLTIP